MEGKIESHSNDKGLIFINQVNPDYLEFAVFAETQDDLLQGKWLENRKFFTPRLVNFRLIEFFI